MSNANAGMLFVFGVLLLITAVIIAGIAWGASTSKAKASAAREANYRELAEKASMDAAEIKASLAEIKGRVSTIERMLREVD
jgi:membrane protein required for beta-lactamase induction